MQIAKRLSENSSANPFSNPKRVYAEVSSLVRRSNIYWRGRSFAASVPSDISKVQKGQKRVSKDERKAMVESFVNKYKAMNAGKFPTVSNARKHVGGSYYVIRKILQELEYKSKISSMNPRNEIVLGKEVSKLNEASINVKKVTSSRLRVDVDAKIHEEAQTVGDNDVDIVDSSLKNAGAEKGPETSTLFEKTLSEEVIKSKTRDDSSSYVEKQRHVSKVAEVIFHQCPEKPDHDAKERSTSEDVLDLDVLEPKREQNQQSSELDKTVTDLSEKQTDEQELPKKASMWGNLKSLADGIMNMWKKL